MTGIGPRYSATNDIAEIAVIRTLCADRFPLSDVLSRDAKSKDFGWHNHRNLRRICFPHWHSDFQLARTDDMSGPEPYHYEEREWIASDPDITAVYVLLFEEVQ